MKIYSAMKIYREIDRNGELPDRFVSVQDFIEIKEQLDNAHVLLETLKEYSSKMADKDIFIGFRIAFRNVCASMVKMIREYQEDCNNKLKEL